jgi:hypothetical protein
MKGGPEMEQYHVHIHHTIDFQWNGLLALLVVLGVAALLTFAVLQQQSFGYLMPMPEEEEEPPAFGFAPARA